VDFADFAVIYEIKFYMGDHSRINEINDAVRTNVWYELKRQGITIPFPIRTLHVERKAVASMHEEHQEARAILRDEALFECLPDHGDWQASNGRAAPRFARLPRTAQRTACPTENGN